MANTQRDPNSKNSQKRARRKAHQKLVNDHPLSVLLRRQLNMAELSSRFIEPFSNVEVSEDGKVHVLFFDHQQGRSRGATITIEEDEREMVGKCPVCKERGIFRGELTCDWCR